MSLARIRAGYVIGFAIGIFFIALGIYSIYYFIAVTQVMEHSNSLYGNYAFAGIFCIIFGSAIVKMSYSVVITFIFPVKKDPIVCSFCGAIVGEDAAVCGKCKQRFDE